MARRAAPANAASSLSPHAKQRLRGLLPAVRLLLEYIDEFSSEPPAHVVTEVSRQLDGNPHAQPPDDERKRGIIAVAKDEAQSGERGGAAAKRLRATHEGSSSSSPPQPRWEKMLRFGVRYLVRQRRFAAVPHSASELRAETEEERGEGTAASAFCTSASNPPLLIDQPPDQPPSQPLGRVLILFSGPYERDDGLAAHLRRCHFDVTTIDNDPVHGDEADDLLDDACFERLQQQVSAGCFSVIFAAPPCSTFSVSRHFEARRSRRGDSGPPPVRVRSQPGGLTPPPDGHADELSRANEIVTRLCSLLSRAHDCGAAIVIENPADRGDPSRAHLFLRSEHAPLWIHPTFIALQRHAGLEICTFAQCMLGARWQKYTSLAFSSVLAPWFADWESLRCIHSNHEQLAGGSLDNKGKWVSLHAAAYPAAMNALLADCLHAAVAHLQALAARGRPQPTASGPKRPRSDQPARTVVRVVPISVGPPALACVPAGGGLFTAAVPDVNGAARKAATSIAAELMPELTQGIAADSVFLAGAIGDELVAVGVGNGPHTSLSRCTSRAQVLARAMELGPGAPVWCSLDVIAEGIGTAIDAEDNAERDLTYRAAAAAIARALSHAAPTAANDAPPLTIGAAAGGSLTRSAADGASLASFSVRHAKALAANDALRAELLREADACGDAALAATYLAWVDRLEPPPLAEIPSGLQQLVYDFSNVDHLADMPFRQRCSIPATAAIPPPAPQQPPDDGWAPSTLFDVLTPDAVRRIRSALDRIQVWHSARRAGANVARPPPLALGASAFQPRARGRIWDLRGCRADGSGRPVLLDTASPPISTHLNIDFLENLFADLADRELLSMLQFGVCVHAELPPQIVIFPNLLSLYDGESGIDAAAKAVSELTSLGWWQQHDFVPFAPWRCAPRGAVPRKDGGAARGIVDQGAPRTPLFTRPGHEPVRSLNDACRQGRERREVKPRFSDLARNAAILLHVADAIEEPVFTVAFDFSKYFSPAVLQS